MPPEYPTRPRELRARAEGTSYRVQLTAGPHTLVTDEPVPEGGSDAGPTPVETFLGGLLGCLMTAFQFHARRLKVPIERIEGWIAADEPGQITAVSVELEVWSAAPEEDVQALLPRAKRGCYVSNVLRPDLAYSVELVVDPPEAAATK